MLSIPVPNPDWANEWSILRSSLSITGKLLYIYDQTSSILLIANVSAYFIALDSGTSMPTNSLIWRAEMENLWAVEA